MNYALRLLQTDAMSKILGPGVSTAPLAGGDIITKLGHIFGFAINLLLVVSAIAVVFYMLWGAFEYISSTGDATKTEKARQKIVNAVIGIIIMIGAFTVWLVVVRDVLGIFGGKNGSIEFRLPTIRKF